MPQSESNVSSAYIPEANAVIGPVCLHGVKVVFFYTEVKDKSVRCFSETFPSLLIFVKIKHNVTYDICLWLF
jgi:hypothetical protein